MKPNEAQDKAAWKEYESSKFGRLPHQEDFLAGRESLRKEAEGLVKALEKSRELWKRHEATKFKSDGSHFQVDQEIREFYSALTPASRPTESWTPVIGTDLHDPKLKNKYVCDHCGQSINSSIESKD